MTNVGSFHGRIHVGQVENKVNDIQNQVSQNVSRIKLFEYKSIDAETRIRRHNLLFREFDEIIGEEDCKSRVKSMFTDEMSIYDGVYIQRVHRLGQLRRPSFSRFRDNRKPLGPRPIIVCFRDYADLEKIIAIAISYKVLVMVLVETIQRRLSLPALSCGQGIKQKGVNSQDLKLQ